MTPVLFDDVGQRLPVGWADVRACASMCNRLICVFGVKLGVRRLVCWVGASGVSFASGSSNCQNDHVMVRNLHFIIEMAVPQSSITFHLNLSVILLLTPLTPALAKSSPGGSTFLSNQRTEDVLLSQHRWDGDVGVESATVSSVTIVLTKNSSHFLVVTFTSLQSWSTNKN